MPPPPIVVMPARPGPRAIWLARAGARAGRSPPAVRILPSPEMTSVPGPISRSGCTPSATSGLPARPRATMRPSLDADVGPDDAAVVEHDGVGDDRVEGPLGTGPGALRHRLADRLPAAEHGLLAACGQVGLDLDPQVGVGEANLVADRRPEHRGVGRPVQLSHRGRPSLLPGWIPGTRRRPLMATRSHGARDSRLEPHRRPARDVQPEAVRRLAVEVEGVVGGVAGHASTTTSTSNDSEFSR